jgi:predicted transporter
MRSATPKNALPAHVPGVMNRDERPVEDHVPIPTGSANAHSRLARWAVGLSTVFAAAVVATIMTFAVGYAVGGQTAIEDNWVAVLGLTMAFVGLLASLAGLVLAIVAKTRRERWTLLWAPLCAFPVVVAFLVLGEAFWWE